MFGREEKVPLIRLAIAQYVILFIFLLLVYGLWRLQVLHSDYYTSMAEQNRVKEVPILAPRGKLLDREGRPIVDNYPSFSALLLRSQGKITDANLDAIASGLHLDPDELKGRVKRLSAMPGYQPIFIKYDITPDELSFVESHRNEFPELDTITVHRRLYPKNGFMAHLIGYVGEVSEEMLNNPRFELYNSGDVVGQSGVEAEYNDMLMGKNGSRRVLVNSKGKEVGELSDTPAIPGKTLKLTVDIDLQIAAEEALGDQKNGAIIAMDPKTGEVLALASRPAFDPNAFAVRISNKDWQALINDPAKPLLNKAIQAQLAPGSTFKIIMAVAGWQEGIAQTLKVSCNGGATFYGRRFGCWVKGGHGGVDLTRGIYQSCDVFFYNLAERLGISRIAKYATMFGLGRKTGIDLPNEVSGIIPSEEWKLKNFRQKWFAGETISVGIGQGAVATTPVQMMRAIGAISMGGRMVRPHVANPDGLPNNYLEVNKYSDVQNIEMDPKGWETITDAMSRVLLPEGTAPSAHIPGVDIAGKTGSAQIVSLALRAKYANKAAFAQNGWFVGFAPRRNPDIVICVLFEGGEHGKLAARIATQVIKAYSDKKNHKQMEHIKAPTDDGTPGEELPELPPSPSTPPPSQAKNSPIGAVAGQPLEVTGFWSDGGSDADHLQAARFESANVKRKYRRAIAAPGMEQYAQNTETHDSPQPKGHGRSWREFPGVVAALPEPVWRTGGAK
ncbi:MAG TPA: penicillin-binding protein 2 [Candidatus Saccharimonadales bacterium]|nr:penicillin-binding protein 2 [Candidatus Saccharimonadales bacterium]